MTGEFEVTAEDGEESIEDKKEQAIQDAETPSTSTTQRSKAEHIGEYLPGQCGAFVCLFPSYHPYLVIVMQNKSLK